MPLPTPFHERTSTLCESHEWRNWSGYLAAGLYEPSHEREYYAIRNNAGLIDISPLYKYEVAGPDAMHLLNRVMTRDISKCHVGQVMYSPWCDERGKVIDDGTIARLEESRFRVTAADPNLRWFEDVGYGLEANVIDVSQDLAALALQGPRSREILEELVKGIDFGRLKYFHLAHGEIEGFPITVTRTGYTGDLGYELWVRPEFALRLWDCLTDRGFNYGMLPAGIIALDIARIEAGLLLIEVDYISSRKAIIPEQESSPYEIGLDWTVKLDSSEFIGRRALVDDLARESKWRFVGLQIHWNSLERLYAEDDLPPSVAGRASRAAIPVFKSGKQIGQMTSQTFSPILKQYIAIGTVLSQHAQIGAEVDVEVTVEYSRKSARATIVKLPFYNPDHKRN